MTALMSTEGDETRTSSLWKMTLSEEDPPKRRRTRTTTIWPLADNIVSRSAPLCPPSPGNVANMHFAEHRQPANPGHQRVSPGGDQITHERQRRQNPERRRSAAASLLLLLLRAAPFGVTRVARPLLNSTIKKDTECLLKLSHDALRLPGEQYLP